MVKKRKLSRNAGYFFKGELLFSDAYVDLPKSARELLHCFVFELKYTRHKRRVSYYNNGDVSFTEIQFKEEFGYVSNTYITARNRLIRNGLVRQTYRGGFHRGDMATYKVLITSDINHREMRWLQYPDKNWEHEIPRSKTKIGIKTRFKSKTTLKKSTLNGELHP